jgi:hypothetical protein
VHNEGWAGVGISIALFVAAIRAKAIGFGIPSGKKPQYTLTKAGRIVLFMFSALFLIYGISELVH